MCSSFSRELASHDGQQFESFGVDSAWDRGENQKPLTPVFAVQDLTVELQLAELGMHEGLALLAVPADVVTGPDFGELLARCEQLSDERLRALRSAARRSAQVGRPEPALRDVLTLGATCPLARITR